MLNPAFPRTFALSTSLKVLLFLASAGALLGTVYYPSLSGSFLLDDVGNLQLLSLLKEGGNLAQLLAFLEGEAGPIGRPVALLTFALQAASWPDPFAFKLFNVALHCANFVIALVFVWLFISRTGETEAVGGNRRVWILCCSVALLWALAPIQTSTVPYVIQRMAMLSATFTLLALIAWLRFSDPMLSARKRLMGVVFLYGGAVVAGLLSKETTILVPFFILVMRFCWPTLFAEDRLNVWLFRIFVLGPVTLTIGYITVRSDQFIGGYAGRSFTMEERLLTQLPIVRDYIFQIVFPVPGALTLMYENYPVSKSLLTPTSTLTSLLFLCSLLCAALLLRTKQPLISFGILLFFVGHLLESTFVSLELYFEHRNYLPSLGVFIAAGVTILALLGKRLYWAALLIVVFWISSSTLATWRLATLWGDPLRQAVIWYERNPTSQRAHGHLASQLVAHGLYVEAAQLYQSTEHLFRGDVTKPLLWLELNCIHSDLPLPEPGQLYRSAESAPLSNEPINILSSLTERVMEGRCGRETHSMILNTVFLFMANPEYKNRLVELNIIAGKLLFAIGRYSDAEEMLHRALGKSERPDILIGMAQIAFAERKTQEVEQHLARAKKLCHEYYSTACLQSQTALFELEKALER